MAYRLKAGEPVSRAIRRIAFEELESAARRMNGRNLRNRDTAIHEARKSIKKIRALLRLMRAELGPDFDRENRRYRGLGRRLSRFREPAAAIETFDDLIARHPGELATGIRLTIRRALMQHKRELERRKGIGRAIHVIAGAFRGAKDRVNAWPLQRDGFAAIEPGLAKTFRQGRKALDEVRKDPNPENYHEWRKRVKDHWYHLRLLAGRPANSMRGHLKKLHRLETWLGNDHNLALLMDKIAGHSNSYGPPQNVVRFIEVSGDYQKKLRKKALSLGERIYEERTGHFIQRMKEVWNGRVKEA